MHRRLLIWNSNDVPSSGYGKNELLIWRPKRQGDPDHAVFVLDIVALHQKEIRARFFRFLNRLHETTHDARTLKSWLSIDEGFSFWWLTDLSEACNYNKSPLMNDAVKALAFQKWAETQNIDEVELVDFPDELLAAFRKLAETTTFSLSSHQPIRGEPVRPLFHRSLKSMKLLWSRIHGLLWLLKFFWTFRTLQSRSDGWKQRPSKVFFASYITTTGESVPSLAKSQKNYWGPLIAFLDKQQISSTWLGIYNQSNQLKSVKEARTGAARINNACKGQHHLELLQDFASLTLVPKTIIAWWRISGTYRLCEQAIDRLDSQEHWLAPVVKNDLLTSISGSAKTMFKLLQFFAVGKALETIPTQDLGFYLQENQAWEMSLLWHWRKNGHKKICAVPVPSLRHWDLRYGHSSLSNTVDKQHPQPLADKLIVNGPHSRQVALSLGYTDHHIIQAEALRYLHLQNIVHDPARHVPRIKVLVLCDYRETDAKSQIHTAKLATLATSRKVELLVKPHPATTSKFEYDKSVRINFVKAPLDELISDVDIVITGNFSMAAIEAYCCGVPTVSLMNNKELDFNLLAGKPGAFSISKFEELTDILDNFDNIARPENSKEIFNLDSRLPVWSRLIEGNFI